MIVVTGGAGFIGANLLSGLNREGLTDVLVVDDLTDAGKIANLEQAQFMDYMDRDRFQRYVERRALPKVEALFHQGACSDTLATDGRHIMALNFEYSRTLLDYCSDQRIPFIYASSAAVYGAGTVFLESPECEHTLNLYAYSKLAFDRYVRRNEARINCQVAGLRYFNVYGRHEQHKGRMASMAFHFYNQYQQDGHVRLFRGSGGYGDGEQRRDFISVDDVVKVNLFFFEHPELSGIFNVGTGLSRSFNDVACAVISSCDDTRAGLDELVAESKIRYIPFPAELVGRYQNHTEADISRLRDAGYDTPCAELEQGVAGYVAYLRGV